MKITKQRIKEIIKEEIQKMNEASSKTQKYLKDIIYRGDSDQVLDYLESMEKKLSKRDFKIAVNLYEKMVDAEKGYGNLDSYQKMMFKHLTKVVKE